MARMPRVHEALLPSLADGVFLECRIYTNLDFERKQYPYPTRGVILAHPYGPLGGSHDDHVICRVAKELVRKGSIVGTFNFR